MNTGQLFTLSQIDSEKLSEELLNVAPIIAVAFLGCGILFILISLPLIYKKIRPNRWYGFRTKKAMSSHEIWYDINSYMAKGILIVGIAVSLANCAALFYIYNGSWTGELSIVLLVGNMALTDGGLIATIIFSFLHLDKLNSGRDDWA